MWYATFNKGANTAPSLTIVRSDFPMTQNFDPISRPSHYAAGRKYETIEVIEDWRLGYRLGNVAKYVSRAGRKDPAKTIEDLKKAQWYLSREIEALEASQAPCSVTYEDVLEDYAACATKGEKLVLEYGVQDVDDQPLSHWEAAVREWAASWDSDDDYMWDPSLGPVELSDKEIQDILDRKDLAQFDDNEIVSTIDKRGFILGVKADGTTCVLKDGSRQCL